MRCRFDLSLSFVSGRPAVTLHLGQAKAMLSLNWQGRKVDFEHEGADQREVGNAHNLKYAITPTGRKILFASVAQDPFPRVLSSFVVIGLFTAQTSISLASLVCLACTGGERLIGALNID